MAVLTRCAVLRVLPPTAEYFLVLELGLSFQLALALFDLIAHEVIDPEAHLNVILEHYHNHAVQGESKIVLLDRELLELFLESPEFSIAFRYDLK